MTGTIAIIEIPSHADLLSLRAARLLQRADVLLCTTDARHLLHHAAPKALCQRLGSADAALQDCIAVAQRGETATILLPGPSESLWRRTCASTADRGICTHWIPAANRQAIAVPDLPLSGRHVLVTRMPQQAKELCRRLEESGASVTLLPTISLGPPPDPAPLARAVCNLANNGDRQHYDMVLFTSANAVTALRAALSQADRDVRALSACEIVAVGPKTAAALADYGLRPDVLPKNSDADGVFAALKNRAAGCRILFPRALRGRESLPTRLRALGALVSIVPAYETIRPATVHGAIGRQALVDRQVDILCFASPSSVSHLSEQLGADFLPACSGLTIATIGPATAHACAKLGLTVAVQADEPTSAALVDSLCRFHRPVDAQVFPDDECTSSK